MIKENLDDLELNTKNILRKVSDLTLWMYYCTNFSINKMFKSELYNDKNPSVKMYFDNNKGRYHDFGTGETHDIFSYICKKYNCTFLESLRIINSDFKLGYNALSTNKENSQLVLGALPPNKSIVSQKYLIHVEKRDFTLKDFQYWNNKYYINIDTLNTYNVNRINSYHLLDSNKKIISSTYCYTNTYSYYYKDYHYKLYAPFGNKKWINNLNKDMLLGYDQLPYKGDMLIITKSLKDVMVLHELGIPAISPDSEVINIPNNIIKELKKRFKYVVSMYDYDTAGIAAATKLDIHYMFLFKTKDISDYYQKYGKYSTYRVLKKLISKSYHRHEKFLFHQNFIRPSRQNNRKFRLGFQRDIPF